MQNKIHVLGIDQARLLAALYNGTESAGLGVLRDLRRDMTIKEARFILANDRFDFDWLLGRPIKIRIKDSYSLCPVLYDRDTYPGACAAIVDSVRPTLDDLIDITTVQGWIDRENSHE